jgi:hypothetical protein
VRKLLSLAAAGLLALAIAGPVSAHPAVPAQSLCVINANAANGIHTAYFQGGAGSNAVSSHVLYYKSPHACG